MRRFLSLSRPFWYLTLLLMLAVPTHSADEVTSEPDQPPEPELPADSGEPVEELGEPEEEVPVDEAALDEELDETADSMEPTDEPLLEPEASIDSNGYPPLSDFAEMMERPLFSSNRRPAPAEATEATASTSAQELKEQWQLTGVVLVGENQMALFAERQGEKRLVLKVGMPLDDHWHLSEIQPHHVLMLNRDEEEARLELREPRQPMKAADKKERQRQKSENGAQTNAAKTNQAATRAQRASAQQAPKENN